MKFELEVARPGLWWTKAWSTNDALTPRYRIDGERFCMVRLAKTGKLCVIRRTKDGDPEGPLTKYHYHILTEPRSIRDGKLIMNLLAQEIR